MRTRREQTNGEALPAITAGTLLGTRAVSGRVGYSGPAYMPPPGAYPVEPTELAWTTVQDSGVVPTRGADLSNLYPLILAALHDVAFASEAGPTSNWNN